MIEKNSIEPFIVVEMYLHTIHISGYFRTLRWEGRSEGMGEPEAIRLFILMAGVYAI